MKIYVIKQFVMTRISIITASILIMIFNNANALSIKNLSVTSKTFSAGSTSENASANHLHTHNNAIPVKQGCTIPVQEENHHTKAPSFDETPHIHHFHKERVKKATRHHNKIWNISQLILILCQVSLLVIGYLHIIH
jgi:hypothetical protein